MPPIVLELDTMRTRQAGRQEEPYLLRYATPPRCTYANQTGISGEFLEFFRVWRGMCRAAVPLDSWSFHARPLIVLELVVAMMD